MRKELIFSWTWAQKGLNTLRGILGSREKLASGLVGGRELGSRGTILQGSNVQTSVLLKVH